jgi:hypothetical protein
MKQQYVTEIPYRRFCRMDKNNMSTVQGAGALRLIALKFFRETVFSSDHNNNLKWAILGT